MTPPVVPTTKTQHLPYRYAGTGKMMAIGTPIIPHQKLKRTNTPAMAQKQLNWKLKTLVALQIQQPDRFQLAIIPAK
jgi:hypothetical protein